MTSSTGSRGVVGECAWWSAEAVVEADRCGECEEALAAHQRARARVIALGKRQILGPEKARLVRMRDALGLIGGSGRIDDVADVGWRNGDVGFPLVNSCQPCSVMLPAGSNVVSAGRYDDVTHVRHRPDLGYVIVGRKHEAHTGIFQHGVDAGRSTGGTEWHDNAAGFHDAEDELDHRQSVRHQKCHAVTPSRALDEEFVRHPIGAVLQHAPGEGSLWSHDGGPISTPASVRSHDVEKRNDWRMKHQWLSRARSGQRYRLAPRTGPLGRLPKRSLVISCGGARVFMSPPRAGKGESRQHRPGLPTKGHQKLYRAVRYTIRGGP